MSHIPQITVYDGIECYDNCGGPAVAENCSECPNRLRPLVTEGRDWIHRKGHLKCFAKRKDYTRLMRLITQGHFPVVLSEVGE